MTFEITGIFANTTKAMLSTRFHYERRKDKIFESEKSLNTQKEYEISNECLYLPDIVIPLYPNVKKIRNNKKFVFLCYDTCLHVFDKKTNTLKEMESRDPVFIGSKGFLLFNRTFFIINMDAQCVFVPGCSFYLNFTADGTIFAVDTISNTDINYLDEQKDYTLMKEGKNYEENDIGNTSQSWTVPNKTKGYFSVQNLKYKHVYCSDGECLFELEEYQVFKQTSRIEDVLVCDSFKIEVITSVNPQSANVTKDCIVALCKSFVFVILEDIIIKKDLDCSYTDICVDELVIHNHIDKLYIHDCLFLISCFKLIKIIKNENIDYFLSRIIKNPVSSVFINNLKLCELHYNTVDYPAILCRVYRLVDDQNKKYLDAYIDYPNLNADQLYLVIIYKPDLLDLFIQKCIAEQKLFYLVELTSFYKKIESLDTLKVKFLESGLLIFPYAGTEKFYEIEKEQIESQRLMHILQRIIYENK